LEEGIVHSTRNPKRVLFVAQKSLYKSLRDSITIERQDSNRQVEVDGSG
jgi:hypothetical protein